MSIQDLVIKLLSPLSHRLLVVILCAITVSNQAIAQQTAQIEYYVSPVVSGVNEMLFEESNLGLTSDLSGVSLTFMNNTFEKEFVAQSTVELTAAINIVPSGLSATTPGQATTIGLEGGDYQLVSTQGEIIEGVLSDASTLELVPYDPIPRVMFFEATLLPETTNVQGRAPGIDATLEKIVVWGLLVTNGTDFDGVLALPGKHQYEISATVN